jgi:hypothetical protein
MNIVIVSTTSTDQEHFWQERLMKGRGQICQDNAIILVVYEDWPGGAGNGLGTLYAVRKAADKSQQMFGIDLLAELQNGAAVALYHTAGKGTRLAPLPGSEINNKSAVKLPGLISFDGEQEPITILEAVIRQTAIYAPSRRGRLSVFWGDQVFIPSVSADYRATHHIDILAQIAEMPTQTQWEARGLHKYGLIAVGGDGNASQVEKISYPKALELIENKAICVEHGIGVSLGSFSISAPMTMALLSEFSRDLDAQKGKLDSDPHFWMPITLDHATYLQIMAQKGVDSGVSDSIHQRMKNFLQKFSQAHPEEPIFGCVDVGIDAYWWDYGQLRHYMSENLKLTRQTPESEAMRSFFGITERSMHNQLGAELDIDDHSILLNCHITRGRIRNSVLVGVQAPHLDICDSLIIDTTASSITGQNILLYNVCSSQALSLKPQTVRADAYLPRGQIAIHTDLLRDGAEDWRKKLPQNPMSYIELHKINRDVQITCSHAIRRVAYNKCLNS